MAEQKTRSYQATCQKASCRYVEYYSKHPGIPRCPKCGSQMVPRRIA